jgi:hypothetical protein
MLPGDPDPLAEGAVMAAGMAMPEPYEVRREQSPPRAGGGGGGDGPTRTGGGGGRGRDDEGRRALERALRRLRDQGMSGDAVTAPLSSLIALVQRYVDAEDAVPREEAVEIGERSLDRFVDVMVADARGRGLAAPDVESYRVARTEVCPVYPLCREATRQ